MAAGCHTYSSTGNRFKKLFLSIVFTILKKSCFLNIQPVHLGFFKTFLKTFLKNLVCAFWLLYGRMYSHVAPVYQKTCIKISTPYVRSYLQTKLAKLVFSSTCCPFVSPYRSTGTRFIKLFLSIVFTILKKSYFWNIQPVHLGFVCDLSQTKKNPSFRDIRRRRVRGAAFSCTTNRGKLLQCTKKVPEHGSPL